MAKLAKVIASINSDLEEMDADELQNVIAFIALSAEQRESIVAVAESFASDNSDDDNENENGDDEENENGDDEENEEEENEEEDEEPVVKKPGRKPVKPDAKKPGGKKPAKPSAKREVKETAAPSKEDLLEMANEVLAKKYKAQAANVAKVAKMRGLEKAKKLALNNDVELTMPRGRMHDAKKAVSVIAQCVNAGVKI